MGPTLRASCDSCNQAKVKCTKQQPQCQRCKKHSIDCIYGISLRAGKRASQPPLPKRVESPSPLSTDWNMDLSTSIPYSPLDIDGICPSMFECDMPFPLEGYHESIFTNHDAFLPMVDLTFPNHIQSSSTTTNTSTCDTSSMMSDSLLLSLSTGMVCPSHTQNRPTSSLTSCGCFPTTILTLSTLQQLSESPHTTFDVALVHNKEAVSSCLNTLKCGCASDSTVVLLVASLLAKIIQIYERPCGAWKAVESRRMSHDSKAVTARLTLGAYSIDESDEEKLKTEIVKMELRKVVSVHWKPNNIGVLIFAEQETVIAKLKDIFNQITLESEQKVHESLVAFLSDKLSAIFDQEIIC